MRAGCPAKAFALRSVHAVARRSVQAAALALVVLGFAEHAGASALVDPALRFRTMPTEHFIIYFHHGEERIAARLAAIAEHTWTALRQPLGATPPRLTHVVLVDQAEVSNGFATPVPYDTIMVTAVWPAGSSFVGNTDDWLRLVFTHEFTHIVHLDRSRGWARLLRGVFGRTPLAFPNIFLPGWQIEGLATYEESAITGKGRLHAGDFLAIAGEPARTGRRARLDRVNGGLIDWPNGNAVYAYGAGFHAYLADTYGSATLATLADATAGRVPYTASRVFKRIFGRSLGDLWHDYQESLVAFATARVEASDGSTQITHNGFAAAGPRFTPSSSIVYSLQTPHDFPSLSEAALDGTATRRLTTRYLGSTAAIAGDIIYFDQQELRRNTGSYSDLYALDRRSGRVSQLTREARLIDPDASPDGQMLVCARNAAGRRDLVLVQLTPDAARAPAITTLISAPDTQFNAPRFSPDGRLVAVERHRRGADPEIVIVDVGTRRVRVLAALHNARVVTPAWRPDGRAIVAAMSIGDDPFNLFEFPLDQQTLATAGDAADAAIAPHQITHTAGGATWPDISADGRTIVFVGYTTAGSDLFTVPYPATLATSAGAQPASPAAGSSAAARQPSDRAQPLDAAPPPSAPAEAEAPLTATRTYHPWSTLAPTSWSPIVEADADQIRVGAAVAGADVLAYHQYVVSASWLASGPADAITPTAATPDWRLYYAYSRWRPAFWASASSETSFFAGPPTAAGIPSSATERSREIEGGMLFPIRHTRTSHRFVASLVRAVDDFTGTAAIPSRNRTAARLAWSTTTAHTYGYSISPEKGVALGGTAEMVRHALGADGDATMVTGDVRAYLPSGVAHHVFAVRAAAGASTGDARMRRTFLLGGAGPNLDLIDFGSDAASLLRGFAADSFAGTHVALVNAEYRLPIAWPQRGVGTWPLFLQSLHAAVFADAGHAWTRAFRTSDLKTDAGAEISTDLVAGYVLPLTATVGVAWGHDGARRAAGGATVYARIGRSF